jgi:tetratricopeptide (TPR) repeat protein
MALGAAGIRVSPQRLVPQVYVPEREGSLPVEMLAAARRNGGFAVPVAPGMEGLLRELAAGHPVVALQNLSLPFAPRWHYAVVIGYDLDERQVILRSGETRRQVMPMSTFERTWARSGYWGMVALAPGKLPASSPREAVVTAALAFEKVAEPRKAYRVYLAASERWPDDLTLQMGAGNTAYASGNRRAAERAFRRAAETHADAAPAHNNLAVVLAEQGRHEEARAAARRALALGEPWASEAQATLDRIDTRRRRSGPP